MSTASVQRITERLERDRADALRAPKRPSTEARPPTAEESAQSAATAAYSLSRSRQIIDSALSEPCLTHGAAAGRYCFGTVKGICKPRRERGLFLLNAIPSVSGVGELGPLAAAVRNAARNRRFRSRTYAAGRSL